MEKSSRVTIWRMALPGLAAVALGAWGMGLILDRAFGQAHEGGMQHHTQVPSIEIRLAVKACYEPNPVFGGYPGLNKDKLRAMQDLHEGYIDIPTFEFALEAWDTDDETIVCLWRAILKQT